MLYNETEQFGTIVACDADSQGTDLPVIMLNHEGWNDTMSSIGRMISYVREIWVVDNGSSEDRSAELLDAFPSVRVINITQNLGWAGGYNKVLGVAAAEGRDFVYILNNDAWLYPGALDRAARSLRAEPRLAAVGSLILTGEDPDDLRVWFDGQYHHTFEPVPELSNGLKPVEVVNGAGFALRISALESAGLFHEEYFLYHEEADWCDRAVKKGWLLAIDQRSWVYHLREASNSGFNSRYYRIRNHFLACRRGVRLSGQPISRARLTHVSLAGLITRSSEARRASAEAVLDGLCGVFGKRPQSRSRTRRVTVTVGEKIGLMLFALSASWGTAAHNIRNTLTIIGSIAKKPVAMVHRGQL